MKIIHYFFLGMLALLNCVTLVKAQIDPLKAGYIVPTRSPYNADSTGVVDATAAINLAINHAVRDSKPVFLPAGTYKVSNQILINGNYHTNDNDEGIHLRGPSSLPGSRAVLQLAPGSFTNSSSPKAVVAVLINNGLPSGANRFNCLLEHIDIEIAANNAGATGCSWIGAEGTSVFDVHIRGVDGYRGFKYGFWGFPGSGGSVASLSVDGGQYGYYIAGIANYNGSRETVSATAISSYNATVAAMYLNNEWAAVITGGNFELLPGTSLIEHPGGGAGHQWTLSGTVALVDCQASWNQPNANNVAIKYIASPRPFYVSNSYFNNCNYLMNGPDQASANPDGWTHFREFAYNSDNRGTVLGYNVKTNIYLDGEKQSSRVFSVPGSEDVMPPDDLQTRHTWGSTFPDILTPGAVLLTDYSGLKNGDDWSPVFQHIIQGLNAPVVIVPKGKYILRNTIELSENTALIGTSHWYTELWGYDEGTMRFGGSTNPPADAKPIIQTVDNPEATCMLANMRVLYDGYRNIARPLAVYPIWWRAGANSVIRMVYARAETEGAFWIHETADKLASTAGIGVSLKSIPSPLTEGSLTFSSSNHTKYNNGIVIADQLFSQTIDGNTRLTAPSVWPFPDDHPDTLDFYQSNIIIDRGGELFTLAGLSLYNASPDDRRGDTVKIVKIDAGGFRVDSILVDLRNISRDVAVDANPLWTSCLRAELTSLHQFDIDNVITETDTIRFSSSVGVSPVADTHYDTWNPAAVWRDLGLSPQYHPNIRITGGVKLYNHFIHGGQAELNYRVPGTMIQGNHSPVHIYHFHAQHADHDQHLKLDSANDVSLYGMKTEHTNSFIRCYNSQNLRFFGMGGATNPVTGHTNFYFQNCSNYHVSNAFDVVYNTKEMIWGTSCRPWCNAHQDASNTFDGYNMVESLSGTSFLAPDKCDRPTLWKMGEPLVSYLNVPLTGMSISHLALNILVDQTKIIVPVFTPTHATNRTVIWTSQDESIAIVDNNGRVTGVKQGITTITANTVEGGFLATCEVTVTQPVTGVLPGSNATGFVVYPNPVESGEFHVVFDNRNPCDLVELRLTDAHGQLIGSHQAKPANARVTINVDCLPVGMYLITAIDSESSLTEKIFVK